METKYQLYAHITRAEERGWSWRCDGVTVGPCGAAARREPAVPGPRAAGVNALKARAEATPVLISKFRFSHYLQSPDCLGLPTWARNREELGAGRPCGCGCGPGGGKGRGAGGRDQLSRRTQVPNR